MRNFELDGVGGGEDLEKLKKLKEYNPKHEHFLK